MWHQRTVGLLPNLVANMGWSYNHSAPEKVEKKGDFSNNSVEKVEEDEEFSEVKDHRKILNFDRKEAIRKQNEPVIEEESFPELGEELPKGKSKPSAAPQKKPEPKKGLLSKSTKETANMAFNNFSSDSGEVRVPKFTSNRLVNNPLTNPSLPQTEIKAEVQTEEPPKKEENAFPDNYGEGLLRSNLKNEEPKKREDYPPKREESLPENYGEGLSRSNLKTEKPDRTEKPAYSERKEDNYSVPQELADGLIRRANPAPKEGQKTEEDFQKAMNFGKRTFINNKGNEKTNLLFQVPTLL